MTESELRLLWKEEYCSAPVYTHDHIRVKFFEDMFDHAFYESADWKRGDKSILSLGRLEKMLWIKDVLADPMAIMLKGWDSKSKSYRSDRRVAITKGDYVVVIWLKNEQEGKFITAYEANNSIDKILAGPTWERL